MAMPGRWKSVGPQRSEMETVQILHSACPCQFCRRTHYSVTMRPEIKVKCARCSSEGHLSGDCEKNNVRCGACGQLGHLKKECPNVAQDVSHLYTGKPEWHRPRCTCRFCEEASESPRSDKAPMPPRVYHPTLLEISDREGEILEWEIEEDQMDR